MSYTESITSTQGRKEMMKITFCTSVVACLAMSTAGCGGQSVSVSTHEESKVSATSEEARVADSATRYKDVQRLSSVSTLKHNPQSVEDFMLHDKLDAAVTGEVLSTRVVIAKDGMNASTFAEFRVQKSSQPDSISPQSVVTVEFPGALTTKGAMHRAFEGKIDESGAVITKAVDPNDPTPLLVEFDSSPPPLTGDELLVFLTSESVPEGQKFWYALSLHRGTYVSSAPKGTRVDVADQAYVRSVTPEIDPGDEHLKNLSVAQLNQVISKLAGNGSSNSGFNHKPL